MKLNKIDTSFFCANSSNKMFRRYRVNDKSLKIWLQIYLEKFTHSFHSFIICFLISLFDSLVIVTNEESILANVLNKETEEVFALILHILFISEILLVIKNH